MRGWVVLAFLAGCDLVFTANGSDPPGDDDVDMPIDADVDAILDPPLPGSPFIPPDRDFDGDGDVDAIDPCPADGAIARGANDTDNDGDGLPNGCDPDVGPNGQD